MGKLGVESPFENTVLEPYFGVIDIENDSLVPLPYYIRLEPYAAVSYVWGDTGSMDYRTKIGNIQSRRKSGGLAATIRKLPKALAQSIRLVHDLGIRYVWIDALCIVQDSSHSWNLNARGMHLIYGNATLTICAADGDSQTGLLALEDDQLPQQQVGVYADSVHLVLHQPPEISIQTSKWNKRAWTFQERLLSKRCLIFTRGQIYFQCRSTSMSEDIFADGRGQGWSLDLVQAPLQMLTELRQRSMWFYAHCVYLYTMRELSHPLDILPAFNGMCHLMERTMRSPFVFGLPTSHFDLALLWEPVDLLTLLDYDVVSREPKYKDIKFPSWSWCGWKSNGIQYKPQMVDGCLSDVHAWLLDHTWIDWHIRDGHGTLRRLWDWKRNWADETIDDKWKGYPAFVDPKRHSALESSASEYGSDIESSAVDHQNNGLNHDGTPTFESPMRNRQGKEKSKRTRDDHNPIFHDIPRIVKPTHDSYGRPLKVKRELGGECYFSLTLPEDPYHVRTASPGRSTDGLKEFPDQPLLQFFTWRTSLYVVRSSESDVRQDDVGTTRARCHIADRHGDKCGSIVVSKEWLERYEAKGQTMFEFIAISGAKSFSQQEFPVWTYYLPKERVESEWDAFFVLLVEEFPEEGIYRRVALGKVFQTAFSFDRYDWKEIILG